MTEVMQMPNVYRFHHENKVRKNTLQPHPRRESDQCAEYFVISETKQLNTHGDRTSSDARYKSDQSSSPSTTNCWLSSPSTLFSNTLHTIARTIHSLKASNNTTETSNNNHQPSPPRQHQQSPSDLIIASIKDEINKSQLILLGKISQLELDNKVFRYHQVQIEEKIEEQVLPQVKILSDLLTSICTSLSQSNILVMNEQQRTQLTIINQNIQSKDTPITQITRTQQTSLPPLSTHSPLTLRFDTKPPVTDETDYNKMCEDHQSELCFREEGQASADFHTSRLETINNMAGEENQQFVVDGDEGWF
ncbi:unnamed protein product [Didymodactylos carnosus]|uniref:Uncharacterized protein n=1 Tax=Didymodactylos carnosus TaxID=1234261 RepID=A0A815C3V1_9BILA|nr:unnamed protein product [Didymodactylos carnosus]CAF1348848.1 unnamed protein product [Didymodactylos carnosus]CAF4066247.1 unnamed protein product [Didymodactylos carnosus]CAF4159536.1 unnamed protein product [Didymodactylos carnosus]